MQTTKTTVTVIGGGLTGLVAAATAAEAGAIVELHEARTQLGGRARSTTAAGFIANWGPHALYRDGVLWAWLAERDLLPRVARPQAVGYRVRWRGQVRRRPPLALVRAAAVVRRHRRAPADRSFRDWLTGEAGNDAAAAASGFAGVLTCHHDPGSLSAAFVHERFRRSLAVPPIARYPIGGWSVLVQRLAAHVERLGVRVVTSSRVDDLDALARRGPVVVAVEQRAARSLLHDDGLRWHGARTALVDVGLSSRRGDPFVVADLDTAAWVERFSGPDPSLAPSGHELVQALVGIEPDEPTEDGVARIEAVLDESFFGWRTREVWRRRFVVHGDAGAVDPPGTTWRDRPAIDRAAADGVWLAGDWVAAPGFYAEVCCSSGIEAGRAAAQACTARPAVVGWPAGPPLPYRRTPCPAHDACPARHRRSATTSGLML